MKKSKHESSVAIIRTYRCNFHFSLPINMTFLLSVIHITEHVIFFEIHVQNSVNMYTSEHAKETVSKK